MSDDFDAEFGEQHVRFSSPTGKIVGHVTLAGPELVIKAAGKRYRFEWHSFHGPTPLNKKGDPKVLPARSPFWGAIELWIKQGKRLAESRNAIWDQP